MSSLTNKRILIGITGSIAAYKTCELVRQLRKQSAEVRVVMTKGGTEFVTPMTLQALSGQRVFTELLDEESEAAMGHIELARWADLILVAPASANFIARFVGGLADDLLTTLCLATSAPIYFAPAMNQQMWLNETTQNNMALLKAKKVTVWGPDSGEQACGEVGPGRMLEPEVLLENLRDCFEHGLLAGKRVIITAGPTQEPIDPVRFLSNRSSGKMGYAIAEAACHAGASVQLISGPTGLSSPDRVELTQVTTAEQMYHAVMQRIVECDVFIATAAVADYRPAKVAEHKLKKTQDELQLTLVKTKDILAEVASQGNRPFVVGFAAESENVIDYAKQKLQKKNLDIIVANQVGEGLAFAQDDNEVTFLFKNGESLALEKQSKVNIAQALIEQIAKHLK